jgi:hypothetical protein
MANVPGLKDSSKKEKIPVQSDSPKVTYGILSKKHTSPTVTYGFKKKEHQSKSDNMGSNSQLSDFGAEMANVPGPEVCRRYL